MGPRGKKRKDPEVAVEDDALETVSKTDELVEASDESMPSRNPVAAVTPHEDNTVAPLVSDVPVDRVESPSESLRDAEVVVVEDTEVKSDSGHSPHHGKHSTVFILDNGKEMQFTNNECANACEREN